MHQMKSCSVLFLLACASCSLLQAAEIRFKLPEAAHVTVAINDANGRRVRNLFGDVPLEAGEHAYTWNGRNDKGDLVPPGEYHWIGLTHGEMHAVYKGSFQHGNPPWLYGKTGGWTSDHSYPVTVAKVGERMLIGSTESEWGHGLIASDFSGNKQWGIVHLSKSGWAGCDTVVSVGERAFAASYLQKGQIWEVDPETGENWIVFEKKDLPEEHLKAATRSDYKGIQAPGFRLVGGRSGELYVADLYSKEPRTFVFTIGKKMGDTITLARVLPVRPWAMGWLSDGRCVAVLDKTVEFVDPGTGETVPLVTTGLSAPYGLAIDKKNRIFVSDQGHTPGKRYNPNSKLKQRGMRFTGKASHQVKIYNSEGKRLAAIGREGGRQFGDFVETDLWRPASMAFDGHGRLWLTELCFQPKRVTVWTIPDDLGVHPPKFSNTFYGPCTYGGGAAMIDPQKPWQIMDTNYGVIFDVDLTTGEYKPVRVPWQRYQVRKEHGYRPGMPFEGKPTTVFKLEGRQFSYLTGGYEHGPEAHWSPWSSPSMSATVIGEYIDDIFKPQAAIGNCRFMMRARELDVRREEQWMPEPILDAAKKLPKWPEYAAQMKMDPDAPDVPHVEHKRGAPVWIVHPWPEEISGFIWIDADGDAELDAEEITFHAMPDDADLALNSNLDVYWPISKGRGGGLYILLMRTRELCGGPVWRITAGAVLPPAAWKFAVRMVRIITAPPRIGAAGLPAGIVVGCPAYRGERPMLFPSSSDRK